MLLGIQLVAVSPDVVGGGYCNQISAQSPSSIKITPGMWMSLTDGELMSTLPEATRVLQNGARQCASGSIFEALHKVCWPFAEFQHRLQAFTAAVPTQLWHAKSAHGLKPLYGSH